MHHCMIVAGGLSQSSNPARPRSAYWSTAKPQKRAKAPGRASHHLRYTSAKRRKKPGWKPEKEWDSSPLTLLERQEQLKRNTLDTLRSHHQERPPKTCRQTLHLHAAYIAVLRATENLEMSDLLDSQCSCNVQDRQYLGLLTIESCSVFCLLASVTIPKMYKNGQRIERPTLTSRLSTLSSPFLHAALLKQLPASARES